MVEFEFLNDWRLEFYFEHNNLTYSLNHITLYYDFNNPIFPDSIEHGSHLNVKLKITIICCYYRFAFRNIQWRLH